MKSDLEIAWCKATPDERQDLVESYADELRQLLPRYNDYDDPETEELLVQGDDDGDDETLDSPELPAVLDTNSISDDDGDFPAADNEEFPAAKLIATQAGAGCATKRSGNRKTDCGIHRPWRANRKSSARYLRASTDETTRACMAAKNRFK